ncbi:MAG TPA: GspH/FimT family pseudopilin [Chthoniobacteraceae bacterium]|jgi:type II secretion system protein H|nr:GspH/FimT family pseudopilin [Chthoniobacteraceae bacterium]
MLPSRSSQRGSAFTLVELILVMALLAVIFAFSAPALGRSMRDRHLKDEAVRLVALTEYARNEAVSQGVPMVVWADPEARRFGVEPKAGFAGAEARRREYALSSNLRVEIATAATISGSRVIEAIEFTPDGTPSLTSAESVRLIDLHESVVTVAQTTDGWGYEVLKEAP